MDLSLCEFASSCELDTFKTKYKLAKVNGRLDKDHPTGYHSVSLCCESYGQFKSRGEGVKESKRSIKFNCPFIMHLISNEDKTKLIIDDNNKKYKKKNKLSVFIHNHECIKYHSQKGIFLCLFD